MAAPTTRYEVRCPVSLAPLKGELPSAARLRGQAAPLHCVDRPFPHKASRLCGDPFGLRDCYSVCDPIFFKRKRCCAAKRTLMVPAPPQLSPLHCRSRSKSGGKMTLSRRWWALHCARSFRPMEHGFVTLSAAPIKNAASPERGGGPQGRRGQRLPCGKGAGAQRLRDCPHQLTPFLFGKETG